MKDYAKDRCLKLTKTHRWCIPIKAIREIWLKTRLECLVFLALKGENLSKSSKVAVNLLEYISSQKHLVDPVGKIFIIVGGSFITSLATLVSFLFIDFSSGIFTLHSLLSPLLVIPSFGSDSPWPPFLLVKSRADYHADDIGFLIFGTQRLWSFL